MTRITYVGGEKDCFGLEVPLEVLLYPTAGSEKEIDKCHCFAPVGTVNQLCVHRQSIGLF